MIFDHGYHLFSLAHYLMGPVEKAYAWIDKSAVMPEVYLDAPAVIMFKFKADRSYGVFDLEHTPNMHVPSDYYVDDDRIEIVGDKGIIFINRYTCRSVDLPELMLYRDGKTTPIPVARVDWADGFIDCTRHMLDALQHGGQPMLDGATGRAVLQFSLAVQQSAKTGREVRPDDIVK
jgi:predicted dehydrogenase